MKSSAQWFSFMNFPGDDEPLPAISILKMDPEFKVHCYLPDGFIKPMVPSFPVLYSAIYLYWWNDKK